MKEIWITFISSPWTYAGIVTFAAFAAAYGSHRIDVKRDKMASHIDSLVIKANETLQELNDVSNVMDTNLNKTEKANEKLEVTYQKTIEALEATIQSKDEVLGMITGGDSYPHIAMTQGQFYLLVNGTYGIPNLNIQIYYLKDYNNIPSKIVSDYLSNKTQTEFIYEIYNSKCRNLGVGIVHSISYDSFKSEFKNKISHGFDIIYQGDFKSWVQRIRLIPVNDKYEVFEELEEIISYNKTNNLGNTRKQVFLKVSDDFPYINKDGENRYCASNCFYIFNHKVHPVPIPNILHKILEKNIRAPYEIDFFSK